MKYTPDMNDGKHVFVFGSNLAGRHGKGAALDALQNWGAKYGFGEGRQGNSYAIPTKDYKIRSLPVSQVRKGVEAFIRYAESNPGLTFLVTQIGCGLAGFTPEHIAPMFKDAPKNCVLPEEFL